MNEIRITQQWKALLNQILLNEEIEDLRNQGLTEEEIIGYIEFADLVVQDLLKDAGLE